METRNAVIYHCVTCGRIVHAELESETPQCCEHKMERATEETVRPGDVTGETPGSVAETATLVGEIPPR